MLKEWGVDVAFMLERSCQLTQRSQLRQLVEVVLTRGQRGVDGHALSEQEDSRQHVKFRRAFVEGILKNNPVEIIDRLRREFIDGARQIVAHSPVYATSKAH